MFGVHQSNMFIDPQAFFARRETFGNLKNCRLTTLFSLALLLCQLILQLSLIGSQTTVHLLFLLQLLAQL